MDKTVLEIRCGTLECFLDRISNTNTESERLQIAIEAGRLAENIGRVTPKASFTVRDYEEIQTILEHFSLAVLCDQLTWAQDSLDLIKDICCPFF